MKMKGTAKRLRNNTESHSAATYLDTVVCSNCGQRFAIQNEPAIQDTELAEKQVAWVADQLVWDHIQERKHHGTIELPNLQ